MTAGQTKEVIVEAADGYGEINEQAVVEVPKERVPTEAHVEGAQLMTQDPDGNVLQPIVTEVKDSTVMLDFNHPLAGKTLTFNIKVLEIQD
jgi:FKBP-type peptidyl-prolyl cis-trans isomerase SlyD